VRIYKLDDAPRFGVVPLAPKHVESACKLLNDYLRK